MAWNEDSLHRWLARRPRSRVAVDFGNDASVLASALRRPVACVDAVVDGVHFEHGTPARLAGAKACARALSDLAATGAEPRAVLLALRAPRSEREVRLRALIAAVDETARAHGAALVGGDTTCAEGPLALTVTALGEFVARGKLSDGSFGGARFESKGSFDLPAGFPGTTAPRN